MQTFLPYADFSETAKVLDWRRLGKQRVEAKQILLALSGESLGWVNHPAVRMWRGYDRALADYGCTICNEWLSRGYQDNQFEFFWKRLGPGTVIKPAWLGIDEFHLSHKSNLKRKLPEHYGPLWPDVPNNLEYIWPS